jgi:two-component system nitrate/nitrite response regulator NarL
MAHARRVGNRAISPRNETSGFASPPHDGFAIVNNLAIGTPLVVFSRSIGIDVIRSDRSLFVSGRLQDDDAYRIVEAGALGIIEKDATFDQIADAITRVARGEAVLSPRVQAAVMAGVRERREQGPAVRLSDREQEIHHGLARGLSAPAIGRELSLSAATVKSYLQRLYDKLGVSDRAAAVAEGMRRGLVE